MIVIADDSGLEIEALDNSLEFIVPDFWLVMIMIIKIKNLRNDERDETNRKLVLSVRLL